MTKTEAIAIFGETAADLARALGVERQAVYQWPEILTKRQEDSVIAACVRRGKAVPEEFKRKRK